MAGNGTSLEVKGLPREAMAELTSKANRLGITPEQYVRELVQEDLALDKKARTTTLSQLMGPGRDVDEVELDKVVNEVRKRYHGERRRKR
jgi:nucleoside-specific outer membrane channel protein Tsx